MARLGCGESFGEMALWSESGLRTASAITDGPCQVIEIPSKDYNEVIRDTQAQLLVAKTEFLKTVACLGVRGLRNSCVLHAYLRVSHMTWNLQHLTEQDLQMLAMATRLETFPVDTVITAEGECVPRRLRGGNFQCKVSSPATRSHASVIGLGGGHQPGRQILCATLSSSKSVSWPSTRKYRRSTS